MQLFQEIFGWNFVEMQTLRVTLWIGKHGLQRLRFKAMIHQRF
jgi:hypothetical protein